MTNGQIETFTVEYIREERSLYFVKGERYKAFLPLDNKTGNILGVVDRFGETRGFPGAWFKRVTD